MIWTKGGHQSAKFQTFNCSCKSSPNLNFHRLLLLKVYKILAKKVQRSYVSWPWRLMQNLKKKWCCFKNDKNLVNFDLNTQKSQNLHFHWFLLCKVFNVWLEKVQRSYFSWHWRVILKNWQEEFDKFWPEHLNVSKIFTLTGSFWAKYILFELKKVQRSYLSWHWGVMQNLKKNSLVVWKMTWGIWQIFTRAL